jgi:hypothetical protein
MMANFISEIAASKVPNPFMLFDKMRYFFLIMIVVTFIHFGWLCSVAIGLHEKKRVDLKLKTTKFKIFFLFSLGYMAFFMVLMGYFWSFANTMTANQISQENIDATVNALETVQPEHITAYMKFIPLLFLLHFAAMFGIFYTMYFTTKTIKTAETQLEILRFSDFAGEFFLIWIFPIGIWIIQPKINQIAAGVHEDLF